MSELTGQLVAVALNLIQPSPVQQAGGINSCAEVDSDSADPRFRHRRFPPSGKAASSAARLGRLEVSSAPDGGARGLKVISEPVRFRAGKLWDVVQRTSVEMHNDRHLA